MLTDILYTSVILGPIIFIIVGGCIYSDGGFNGTVMEKAYPLMFDFFIFAFAGMLIACGLFKNHPKIMGIAMWIFAIILGTTVVVLKINNFSNAYITMFGILAAVGLVYGLIRFIGLLVYTKNK